MNDLTNSLFDIAITKGKTAERVDVILSKTLESAREGHFDITIPFYKDDISYGDFMLLRDIFKRYGFYIGEHRESDTKYALYLNWARKGEKS